MKRKINSTDNELSPRCNNVIIKDEHDENLWSVIDNGYQTHNSSTIQFKEESIENEIKQETTSQSSKPEESDNHSSEKDENNEEENEKGESDDTEKILPSNITEKRMPGWARMYFRVKARPRRYGIYLEEDENLPVGMSLVDKPKEMEVSKERDRVIGYSGYRTAKGSHGVYRGCWYYEVIIEHLGKGGASRIGWTTLRGEACGPVGCCNYGYSYRNIGGTKQHLSLREEYGEAYTEGDVIGCLIYMSEGGRRLEKIIKDIVRKFGTCYYLDETGPDPEILRDSFILFTKNGKSQGIAYKGLKEGTYYPAISLFCSNEEKDGTRVKTNFGPEFLYDINTLNLDYKVNPMCDAIHERNKDRIFQIPDITKK